MGFKLWFNLLDASNYIYVLVHLHIYVCKKGKGQVLILYCFKGNCNLWPFPSGLSSRW